MTPEDKENLIKSIVDTVVAERFDRNSSYETLRRLDDTQLAELRDNWNNFMEYFKSDSFKEDCERLQVSSRIAEAEIAAKKIVQNKHTGGAGRTGESAKL